MWFDDDVVLPSIHLSSPVIPFDSNNDKHIRKLLNWVEFINLEN